MKTGFTSGNSGNFYRNLPSMFLRDLFSYYPGYLHKEKENLSAFNSSFHCQIFRKSVKFI